MLRVGDTGQRLEVVRREAAGGGQDAVGADPLGVDDAVVEANRPGQFVRRDTLVGGEHVPGQPVAGAEVGDHRNGGEGERAERGGTGVAGDRGCDEHDRQRATAQRCSRGLKHGPSSTGMTRTPDLTGP